MTVEHKVMTTPDSLTVIRARGRRLAKLIRPGGSVEGYDDAKHFDLFTIPVPDLAALQPLLRHLLHRPDCAVIRGAIADPDRVRRVRRLVHPDPKTGDQPTLHEVPRWWLALDVDGVARPDTLPATDLAGCAAEAVRRLPGAFRSAACIVVASAGHGIKPGCRLRLWYWLDRATTGAELTQWLEGVPVDHSVFRTVQPIYTAAPVFAPGAAEHLPCRIAELPGAPVVAVPSASVLAPKAPAPPTQSSRVISADERATHVMQTVLLRLETATQGQRHDRLRAAARTIGGLLDTVGSNEADAARVLMDAVKRAGGEAVVERNAARTISWGLAKGRQSPLKLAGPDA